MCVLILCAATSPAALRSMSSRSLAYVILYISLYYYIYVLILIYVSHYCICVVLLLYMCPHTTAYVSSASTHAATSPAALTTDSKGMYICVLMLQAYKLSVCICPHTTTYAYKLSV